jgi:Flp pilus assembly protein TadG
MGKEKRLPPRGRRRKGGAVVEAAMILPLLLMFFFGILEYSRWLMTIQTVHNAVVQGAEYAAKHTDPIVLGGTTYQPTDYSAVITQYMAGLTLQNQVVSIYQSDAMGNNLGVWTGAQTGTFVCVQITGNYSFLQATLLGFSTSIPVSFKSVKASEGN